MGAFQRVYRKIADTARHDGISALLWKGILKAASPFGRLGMEMVFYMDLTRPMDPRAARVGVDIEEASEADADSIVAVRHPPLPAERLENARERALHAVTVEFSTQRIRDDLRRGEKCFIARIDGAIAHTNWTRFHHAHPIPGCAFALQPHEVFTTDAFTAPAWRGKRLHETVLNDMLRRAAGAGRRVAYTSTEYATKRSRRALLRLGWSPLGNMLYFVPRGRGRTYMFLLNGSFGPLARVLPQSGDARALNATD